MVAASEIAPFDGKYKAVVRVSSSAAVFSRCSGRNDFECSGAQLPESGDDGRQDRVPAALPKASISAAAYGLSRASLMVHTAEDAKRFAVTSASLTLGAVEPRSPQNAAESYTEDLFQRGRVNVGEYAHPGIERPFIT